MCIRDSGALPARLLRAGHTPVDDHHPDGRDLLRGDIPDGVRVGPFRLAHQREPADKAAQVRPRGLSATRRPAPEAPPPAINAPAPADPWSSATSRDIRTPPRTRDPSTAR